MHNLIVGTVMVLLHNVLAAASSMTKGRWKLMRPIRSQHEAYCRAVIDAGPQKKWERRRIIFLRSRSTDNVSISTDVDPTGGKNLDCPQLEAIWKCLDIKDPVVPRPNVRGKLTELVKNRCEIAHGTSSPAQIGARYTPSDLEKIYNDISEICTYVITIFESYLMNGLYIQ